MHHLAVLMISHLMSVGRTGSISHADYVIENTEGRNSTLEGRTSTPVCEAMHPVLSN